MIIKQRLLPDGKPNKPNKPIKKVERITIHNTENSKGTAECHSRYILNGGNGTSWHYTVDDKDIYQHLRDNEQGWHAGDDDGKGNTASIGIEVCMYTGMDTDQCWRNAAWLIAKLLYKHKLGMDRVVAHKKWTGKQCPAQILPYWSCFMAMVKQELQKIQQNQESVKIFVNGKQVQDGRMISGITHGPLRAILEELGMPFKWYAKEKKMEIYRK